MGFFWNVICTLCLPGMFITNFLYYIKLFSNRSSSKSGDGEMGFALIISVFFSISFYLCVILGVIWAKH